MAVTAQRYQPDADLDQLVDHPKNPRRGDDQAVASSVDRNGFYGAIIAQHDTNVILAGHTRRRVLLDGGVHVGPVIWLQCDDQTAERILLADNRTAELAFWDTEMLMQVLTEHADTYGALDGIGFTADDLAVMVERFGPGPDLDDVIKEHAPQDESELWPRLRIALPPEEMRRYLELAKATGTDVETQQFIVIMGWAEAGSAALSHAG